MRRVLSGCQAYGAGIDWTCAHCVRVPCEAGEMDSARSSIRAHGAHAHHKAVLADGEGDSRCPRFPKLDECAHFHYEHVELGALQVSLLSELDLSLSSRLHAEDAENHSCTVQVSSQGKSWLLRRTYHNFRTLDSQLHRCIYDRKFSTLPELPPEDNLPVPPGLDHEEAVQNLLSDYLNRFSVIAGNLINCGPVLSWFELDNRGHRLLVPDNDSCPINTPAVAAAYSVKRYSAQAQDEISFEVGDMISVIDMPPPEESVWWRGKRGFEVGFFPSECVAVIGDKVPRNLQLCASAGSSAPNSPRDMVLACQPSKPVLRKHGKLIAFFRSFILSRPSRRRLKQSGILKERVFGCDLGEHLLNSGHDIPMVLKCCSEFIETYGIVDGIYRLSGVTSNIQKLRNAFDEDRVPGLYEDEAILQDIHSVASLLKMYFRELPNPLCTYQLYHQFVGAVQNKDGSTRDGPDESRDSTRLMLMRDAVQKLPPPHYRTLQYLVKHLARVAEHGHQTGMTPRNVAIVWAPNLLRCKALEVGGVAALQGVGVQAVVTEFLICYADLIFCDRLPTVSLPIQQATPKRCRPKSLAISTPTKLLSLEEARTRALLSAAGKTDQEYIEVGGGPSSLPAKYHTVIDLPSRKRSGSKRSPLGWKSFFSKAGRSSGGSGTHSSRKAQQQQQQQLQKQPPPRKTSTPSTINFCTEKAVTESDVAPGRRRLRPVKSAESLASGNNSSRNSAAFSHCSDAGGPNAGCASGVSQGTVQPASQPAGQTEGLQQSAGKVGHNRSVSHDSYFDHLAETPLLSRQTSSRLHDGEGFSSSLDLSEIQLNFELEESEMRIFSEDETLVSTFDSASMMSQGSPHTNHISNLPRDRHGRNSLGVGKRLPPQGPPLLARAEDSASGGCASPKKQKTSGSVIKKDIDISSKGEPCKRSRLEEQLSSSASELRYIDSQSPEQQATQQQVLVQVEVHHSHPSNNIRSSSLSSNGMASSSPSPAEAPASDNESMTHISSDLTTPDTPLLLYSPLREDGESSGSGIGSTPDYENMHVSTSKISPHEPRYVQLTAQSQTPSPSQDGRAYDSIPIPKPRFQALRTPYENIQRDFLAAEMNASRIEESDFEVQHVASVPYENLRREFLISNNDAAAVGSPTASSSVSPSLSAGTTAVRQLESSGEDDTLEVSQDNFSLDLNAGFDHIYSEIMAGNDKEEGEVCNMSTDSCEAEDHLSDFNNSVASDSPKGEPTLEPSGDESRTLLSQNVYQNVPNVVMENKSLISPPSKSDDDVYEDFVFEKEGDDKVSASAGPGCFNPASPVTESCAPLDPNAVYQQVKYLRRSIHEVNALLEGSGAVEDADLLALVQNVNDESYEAPGAGVGDNTRVPAPYPETHFGSEFAESSVADFRKSESLSEPENDFALARFPEEMHVESASNEVTKPAFRNADGNSPSRAPIQGSEFPAHCDSPVLLEGASTVGTGPGPEDGASEELGELAPPVLKGVVESRRRFESEIGRELVRERRMNQELQEVRTAKSSPQDSPVHGKSERPCDRGSKSSVKELLSRFEATPMDSDPTVLSISSPVPARRSDPQPHPRYADRGDLSSSTLPPCLRARAARIARTKLNSTATLSASLDEDHFLMSGGSRGEGRALIRTQTEPDVNTENQSTNEQSQAVNDSASYPRLAEGIGGMLSQEDDPQRRERIERYKEERRSFLRKKYRSESFRCEQDDTLARLKQKAVGKTGPVVGQGTPDAIPMDVERCGKQQKTNQLEIVPSERPSSIDAGGSPTKSPSKSRVSKNGSSSSPTSPEPITCVTVRQRIVTPDKVSLKGCDSPLSPKSPRNESQRFGFSPEKVSSEKVSSDRRFSERTRIPVSVELSQADRRPAQLVLVQRSSLPVVSSERRMSAGNKDCSSAVIRGSSSEIRRRASSDSNPALLRSPTKSPSYCIRDMAALFEAKESEMRNSSNNVCAKSNSSAGGKNCLSSA